MMYAEDVNYWQSSTISPDSWIYKAKQEIVRAKGVLGPSAFGDDGSGRAAFMLEFSFGSDRFRIVWPVLKSKTKNDRAAKIQAATMLYHDVKAKCVSAKVHGTRAAFFQYAMLPDGRTAAQLADPEIVNAYPKLLT